MLLQKSISYCSGFIKSRTVKAPQKRGGGSPIWENFQHVPGYFHDSVPYSSFHQTSLIELRRRSNKSSQLSKGKVKKGRRKKLRTIQPVFLLLFYMII